MHVGGFRQSIKPTDFLSLIITIQLFLRGSSTETAMIDIIQSSSFLCSKIQISDIYFIMIYFVLY